MGLWASYLVTIGAYELLCLSPNNSERLELIILIRDIS